jgi:phosphomannomutase
MNPAIFKAYDVRGLYPEELDPPAAQRIGRALASWLRKQGASDPLRLVVGRDMRESGIALRESLVAGLRSEGCEVIDIGRVATPMVYFATSELGAAGGVMITASHNPGRYNGLKICREQAIPIGIESGLREIADIALGLDAGEAATGGSLVEESIHARYRRSMLELFQPRASRRLVIDAGNGIAGEAVDPLLAELPLEVERLYFEPDGSFPNHEADPIKAENLEDLQRAVVRSGAELGVAFDGDGDRAVFVDERGDAVPADLMTALFVRSLVADGLLGADAGSTFVYDLRSSRVVAEQIQALGATPLRSRVGHAFIKLTMRENAAVFGGELSGHYYFRFPAGYVADDGIAAFLLLLRVLEDQDKPLSELWRPLRRYAQSGEVNRRVADVEATTQAVRRAYADGESDELDGLTVQYPDWWFNLRPSNTEPLLRLNVEADSVPEMERRREELLARIEA